MILNYLSEEGFHGTDIKSEDRWNLYIFSLFKTRIS